MLMQKKAEQLCRVKVRRMERLTLAGSPDAGMHRPVVRIHGERSRAPLLRSVSGLTLLHYWSKDQIAHTHSDQKWELAWG